MVSYEAGVMDAHDWSTNIRDRYTNECPPRDSNPRPLAQQVGSLQTEPNVSSNSIRYNCAVSQVRCDRAFLFSRVKPKHRPPTPVFHSFACRGPVRVYVSRSGYKQLSTVVVHHLFKKTSFQDKYEQQLKSKPRKIFTRNSKH
ncbi:unnamed protein product, partial [Brenthis ino]